MNRGFVRRVLVLAIAGFAVMASQARAAAITFTATDLGASMWQYDYVVGSASFNAFEGFAILYDPTLYADLSGESTANPGWILGVQVTDPLLPDPGRFDAVALVNGASIASPFSIQFRFLGAGGPGGQPFELTVFDGPDFGFVSSTPAGQTVRAAVPEPSSLLLFASGLAGAVLRLRRRHIETFKSR
jgi:hypothetical protein